MNQMRPEATYRPARQGEDALLAFSQARLSKECAIAALGLHDYAQLLLALGERGLQPPRLPPQQVEAMKNAFVGLLRETRRDDALHPCGP